ncbi:hypothetical protein DL765_000846 [Monosporascus sp. GIB2]|nr:hypothetical protein DL765_000846 [Monosporascus sp. GIB2]
MDKAAEEEQRRQEGQIRAMWAADRIETARLASSAVTPLAMQKESRYPGSPPSPKRRRSQSSSRLTPRRLSEVHAAYPRIAPESPVPEPDDDDLTAALVSYLTRRESSPTRGDHHFRLGSSAVIDKPHPFEARLSPSRQYIHIDGEEDGRSRRVGTPAHARYEPYAQPGQYREQNPTIYYPNRTSDPGVILPLLRDREYEQVSELLLKDIAVSISTRRGG